jgi:hypothetical protein
MKEHIGGRIHTISDGQMDKLQRILGSSCFNFIKKEYNLIIFGDTGRPVIIEKVLHRVIVATLGKVGDDIYIPFIIDADGVELAELKRVISTKLRSISRDRATFTSNRFPTLKEHNDSFILRPLRGKGIVEVQLLTVPESLELQIARKFVEVECPNNAEILENGPHDALDSLANKYCGGNKEKLNRKTSALLKDETWVTDVVDCAN